MKESPVTEGPEETKKKLVPPAGSSSQPLWLTQDHPVTDLSGFAPKIVVVGVGGAGGNAGEWVQC